MSVLLETSLGDIVIDLYVKKCPKTCENFIKLCKTKYYNFCLFHNVQKGFMVQTGDPQGNGTGGESVWGLTQGPASRYFAPELHPKLKHKKKGIVSMATTQSNEAGVPLCGSQFFITTSEDPLDYLDGKHAVFGCVAEGLEVLDKINDALVDDSGRPFRDIRIKHTVILDDPFEDPQGLRIPSRSPSPTPEMLANARLSVDEDLFPDGEIDSEDYAKKQKAKEAAAQSLTLEMIGDLPFAEIKPPENVLFVCKLNPITRDEDLELIFSRFGNIVGCEIVRDKNTGDSLCYAFIEFDNKDSCEEAYFKMDNVLIDDRRIHVDFSQSVSRLHKEFLAGGAMGDLAGNDEVARLERRWEQKHYGGEGFEMVFEHGNGGNDRGRHGQQQQQQRPQSGDVRERERERERERDRNSGRPSSSRPGDSDRHVRKERRRSKSRSRSRSRSRDRDRKRRDRSRERDRSRDRRRDRSRDRYRR